MFKSRLNLQAEYQKAIDASQIQENPQQKYILSQLEACYSKPKKFKFPWQRKLLEQKNVYIYGSVGSGKTFVMDMFFAAIPHEKKLRIHFHQFMENIAESLRQYQGHQNPMQHVVRDLVKRYQVICLDEMMVHDVVQAMLLLELIPPLMSKHVMLVFTSNIEPQQLYLNGLQRERFLSVIDHILTYSKIIGLSSCRDYRQQKLPRPSETYFTSLEGEMALKQMFLHYAKHYAEDVTWHKSLLIQQRTIPVIAFTECLVWFRFADIAQIPRCQRDYLELVQKYHIVFVSEVPGFTAHDTSSVILWMHLIDVLYNAQVKLVLHANEALDALYPKDGPMSLPFQRTLSRMQEMQSIEYWHHD